VTLKNFSWLGTLSIFHQPEAMSQPPGTRLWWGYSFYPSATAISSPNTWMRARARKFWRSCCGN
jgi:hypothetical protein